MTDQSLILAAGQKRKQPQDFSKASNSTRNTKRAKHIEARTILTQASDKALNQNGTLDVSGFVKAREFEIKAMEESMGASKRSLSSRAFQQVPNELRRRTASHNVKKVPKKLRKRAAREMKEDNTPPMISRRRKATAHMRLRLQTVDRLQKMHAQAKKKRAEAREQKGDRSKPEKGVTTAVHIRPLKKNVLSKPEQPAAKFRKRQKHKSWLPTHVYHAKRAHMTEPKHPLWRFAIPLRPMEKSFRKTHRAGSLRGCVAWDTSYMSTIGVGGVEASLLGLLRGLGVDEGAISSNQMAKWRAGTRSWHGWVRERDGERRWISEVDIVWCVQEGSPTASEDPSTTIEKKKRRLFVRVHPSAFLQLWTETLKIAKMQRPSVTVEDLRFEIGTIQLTGPGSTEALLAALQPVTKTSETPTVNACAETWTSLGLVTNPSTLPQNAVLGFNVSDPRLRYPPRTVKPPASDSANDDLLQVLAEWPPDKVKIPQSIFDRTARLTASRLLPSQKAINRRKGEALPGDFPSPAPTDPQIPVLLVASRSPICGSQGSWTLYLPWKCVLPVWYHIMHYPLSTGGNPRFGCLEEKRQIAFEQGLPWFPGDYPGTPAGWEWELKERAERNADWEKRPKGKRIAWESLELGKTKKGEIGLGSACDWSYLLNSAPDPASASQAIANEPTTTEEPANPARNTRENSKGAEGIETLPRPIHQVPLDQAVRLLANPKHIPPTSHDTTTVSLTLLSRGHPVTCARIYRLPTSIPTLRSQWLALAASILYPPKRTHTTPIDTSNRTSTSDNKILASLPRNESHPLRTQHIAFSLLHPRETATDGPLQPGSPAYPCVPDAEDLIGFVTTGNYDLGLGKGSAIGNIALAKVVPSQQQQQPQQPSTKTVTKDDDSSTTDGKGEATRREIAGLETKMGKKMVSRLCVVRDAGQTVGRLAKWELV
ncbi:MAG: hypothetical protein L6R36_008822 [Xanthoria steineri]|nr:MAG: hypothetical protein L6R36_008822 [Xanthoria steineri]